MPALSDTPKSDIQILTFFTTQLTINQLGSISEQPFLKFRSDLPKPF